MLQIGNNLKQLRRKMGLRQSDIANMVKVERSTVSNWECGVKQPSLNILVKLSEIYGVSLDKLVGINKTTPALFTERYCFLISDPLVKLLAERIGVPAKSIVAFITAFQLLKDHCENQLENN